MNPNHLSSEQLSYELELRGLTNINNRRSMVAALREFLQDEMKRVNSAPKFSSHIFPPREEIKECINIFNTMTPEDWLSRGKDDLAIMEVAKSKLIHLRDRVKRIQSNEPESGRIFFEILTGSKKMLEHIERVNVSAEKAAVNDRNVGQILQNTHSSSDFEGFGMAELQDHNIGHSESLIEFRGLNVQERSDIDNEINANKLPRPSAQNKDSNNVNSNALQIQQSVLNNVPNLATNAINLPNTLRQSNALMNANTIRRNNLNNLNLYTNINKNLLNYNFDKNKNNCHVNLNEDSYSQLLPDENRAAINNHSYSIEEARLNELENKLKNIELDIDRRYGFGNQETTNLRQINRTNNIPINNNNNFPKINFDVQPTYNDGQQNRNRDYHVPDQYVQPTYNDGQQNRNRDYQIPDRCVQPTYNYSQQNRNRDYHEPDRHFQPQVSPQSPRLANDQRRKVPPSQWKISYNGEGSIELFTFLKQINALRRAESVYDDRELIYAMIHLLTGRARQWYLGVYEYLHDWRDFEQAIKSEFLPPNYDFVLMAEIDREKQKIGESCTAYVGRIRTKFSCLSTPISDARQVFTVLKNLQQDYSMTMSPLGLQNLDELLVIGKRIDSVKAMMSRNNFERNHNINSNYPMRSQNYGMRNINELVQENIDDDQYYENYVDINVLQNSHMFNNNQRNQTQPQYRNVQQNKIFSNNNQIVNDNQRNQHFKSVQPNHVNNSNFQRQQGVFMNNQQNQAYSSGFSQGETHASGNQQNQNKTSNYKNQEQSNTTGSTQNTENTQVLCWNCRQVGHPWINCTSTKRIFCYRCGKLNMTIRNCSDCYAKFSRNYHQGNPQILELEENNDSIDINILASDIKSFCPFPDLSSLILNPIGDNRPHAEVSILGEKITGLLDSGANASVLGQNAQELLEKLQISTKPYDVEIRTADGTKHKVTQYADIPFVYNGKCKIIPTLILPDVSAKLILGMDFWNSFNIQPQIIGSLQSTNNQNPDEHVLNDHQLMELQSILKDFPFSKENEIGCTKLIKHNIDTQEARPIKQKQYVVSPHIQKEVNDEIDRWLKLGIIEPAFGSWSNPIVAVRKPSGKLRLCLDARKLNEITVKEAYPLPQINRILANLGKTRYVTSIDLSESFLQVELDDESKPKTAFAISGKGYFCFKRMPFGLCNSSATMSRLMDQVIGIDLEPNVFVYLDDIVIATENFENHMTILKTISDRLKAANLTVSVEKSKFCLKKINYLGYIIGEGGIRTNPDKISSIVNYPTPKTVREVRRLIGLANWYRRFVQDFATIVAPLTNLIRTGKKNKNKKFVWDDMAENAFKQLKTILITSPVLTSPDYSKEFTIQTDASDIGIGAVLTQGSGDDEKVICYMSQKLTSTQQKYQTTERELLAVLTAINKFRPYIEGSHFTIITDSASLQFLRNLKDPTGRLARWALKLQQFNFTVVHRKGLQNVVPDVLSRAIELIEVTKFKNDNDEIYKALIKKIIENPKKFSHFRYENDVLYKHCSNRFSLDENINGFRWRIYVPFHSRTDVLRDCHNSTWAAHGGYHKTLKRVQENYYWPRMIIDIRKYVNSCDVCKSSKPANNILRAPMGKHKEFDKPWQAIAMDFIGPLPMSKNGNRHILVVIDLFSKFVVIHPLRVATTKHTVEFLENRIFSVFGVPQFAISDNGSQFISNEFKKFLARYKVNHWLTSRYHPQANATEAANKTIGCSIRAFIQENNENHRSWDTQLAKIACAMNTSVHSSSKFSPYYINFGQHMPNSGDVYDHPMNDNIDEQNRSNKIEKIRNLVVQNLKKAYEISKRTYDLRARPVNFDVDEIIWHRNFIKSDGGKYISAKLSPKFLKARIKRKIGSNNYEIVNLHGKSLGIFNAKDLKKSGDNN